MKNPLSNCSLLYESALRAYWTDGFQLVGDSIGINQQASQFLDLKSLDIATIHEQLLVVHLKLIPQRVMARQLVRASRIKLNPKEK